MAQLGNRLQHALRAFTPRDQKAVKAAAETFRPNPKLNTAQVITQLGKGEALVSFLEGGGTPSMVDRTMIRPPSARIGPITPEERKAVMAKSPVEGKYDQTVDAQIGLRDLAKPVGRPAARLPPAGAASAVSCAVRRPLRAHAPAAAGGMLHRMGEGFRQCFRHRPAARHGVDDLATSRAQRRPRRRRRRRDAGGG